MGEQSNRLIFNNILKNQHYSLVKKWMLFSFFANHTKIIINLNIYNLKHE